MLTGDREAGPAAPLLHAPIPRNQAFAPLGLQLSIHSEEEAIVSVSVQRAGHPPRVCFSGAQHRPLSRQTKGSGAGVPLAVTELSGTGASLTFRSGRTEQCRVRRSHVLRGQTRPSPGRPLLREVLFAYAGKATASRRQPPLQSRGPGHFAADTVLLWHPLHDAHFSS